MEFPEKCKPLSVFKYFEALSSVPHGSGNTKAISDICVEFAKRRGLLCYHDEYNNVVIYKEGSAGRFKFFVFFVFSVTFVLKKRPVCVEKPRDGCGLTPTARAARSSRCSSHSAWSRGRCGC